MSEAEVRARVVIVAAPRDGGWSVRRSSDAIRLRRTAGQVSGSVRVPSAAAAIEPVREAAETALDRLRVSRPDPAVQSVLISATGRRVEALARVERPYGPVVLGGHGTDPVGDLLAAIADLPGAVPHPAPDWQHRPLLVRPVVVSVVLAALRGLLGSPGAHRWQHRRLLPDLSLTDRPTAHDEGEPDDEGHPAAPLTLIDRGRITLAGPVRGRAMWDHDAQRAAPAPTLDLELSAAPADPGEYVELICGVEGLRRYHPDGVLRMSCVARAGEDPRWFRLSLRGRPLAILRAVLGGCGPARPVFCEHVISTPSLLLPSAGRLSSLEGGYRVRVSPL